MVRRQLTWVLGMASGLGFRCQQGRTFRPLPGQSAASLPSSGIRALFSFTKSDWSLEKGAAGFVIALAHDLLLLARGGLLRGLLWRSSPRPSSSSPALAPRTALLLVFLVFLAFSRGLFAAGLLALVRFGTLPSSTPSPFSSWQPYPVLFNALKPSGQRAAGAVCSTERPGRGTNPSKGLAFLGEPKRAQKSLPSSRGGSEAREGPLATAAARRDH